MTKRLQDAIETLSLHAESGLRLRDFADEIRLVVNAIEALTCRECNGSGLVFHYFGSDAGVSCPKCKCYRQAMGGRL